MKTKTKTEYIEIEARKLDVGDDVRISMGGFDHVVAGHGEIDDRDVVFLYLVPPSHVRFVYDDEIVYMPREVDVEDDYTLADVEAGDIFRIEDPISMGGGVFEAGSIFEASAHGPTIEYVSMFGPRGCFQRGSLTYKKACDVRVTPARRGGR